MNQNNLIAEIIIIDSPKEDSPFDNDDIVSLLSVPKQELAHGSDFTGKPDTVLHLSEGAALKLRRESGFQQEKLARHWVNIRLHREIEAQIYHPSRTWFICRMQDIWYAGNITQRLTPINQLFAMQEPSLERSLTILLHICDCYCAYAARYEKRLDEGLSNFATDDAGKVYYIDDDIFQWDQFHGFSCMVAGWFRHFAATWLTAEFAATLGRDLRAILIKYFENALCADTVREQLSHAFLAEKHRPVMQAMLDGLRCASSTVANARKKNEICKNRPLGLIADVHANIAALETALNYLHAQGVQDILMLGDVVGYGPHPIECIERLQQVGAVCIRGNHDHFVGTLGKNTQPMARSAKWAAEWTAGQINDNARQWLATLPVKQEGENWVAVHGAPVDPTFFNAYVYQMTYERNLDYIQEEGLHIAFHGHTHVQGAYRREANNCDMFSNENMQYLEKVKHALICPGSIGQPRGGNTGVELAIYDPTDQTIDMHRLQYNLKPLLKTMRQLAFPEQLINRLQVGI
ncbi:MAG: metallophosphoesterase family protein [Mariprofundales bacterium]